MTADMFSQSDQYFDDPNHVTYQDGDTVVLDNDMTFEVLVHNLCVLRITGGVVPLLTPQKLNAMHRVHLPCMQHGGILLDLQAVSHLSVVRLANFLDNMTPVVSLIAVLFRDKEQSHLARLLHNTLVHKEAVAYFTDVRAAFMYLALTI